MSDDILFTSLLTAPVPPACTRTRGTLLAAEFQKLYGPEVATALHTPPIISASLTINSAATRASEAMSLPWILASVDDLARRLEAELHLTSRHVFVDLRHTIAHSITGSLIEKRVMHSLIMFNNMHCNYFMLERYVLRLYLTGVYQLEHQVATLMAPARINIYCGVCSCCHAQSTRRKLFTTEKAKGRPLTSLKATHLLRTRRC
ncbi:hypothetical protein EDB19DRAFT_422258 [Suillus lakei]|nr:hypothetical protein EDB19DRAFT_422258 [Suillus lakei]